MGVAAALREGQSVVGVMIRMVRHPAIATLARQAGLDFFMLDLEHGSYAFDVLEDIAVCGRAEGIDVFVRVPELSRGYVSRALDCGVVGIMAPMLETVEQARNLVRWSKYPPLGGRGFGSIGGGTQYSKVPDVPAYLERANQQTIAIAQIETIPGVNNAADIARVPGIDVLLVGPHDLAISLGKPGQLRCPEEDAAIRKISDGAKAGGKVFGIHSSFDFLEHCAGHGMRMYMNSLDTLILADGLAKVAQQTRALAEAKSAERKAQSANQNRT